MKRTIRSLALLIALTIVAGASEINLAFAGEREELIFMEIPMIVAASRHEQKISEAPSSVTVITAQDIKDFGYTNLEDVLRSVPGFFTYYDREYELVGVRGFGRPGDYNSRIKLMIDGHYLNEDIYASAATGNALNIDLDLIKRVEIIRGPGSALYGSNALFAVINIITKSAKDINGPATSLKYGSLTTAKGTIAYGKELGNGADILVAGTALSSGGNETLYYAEFDDPSTNNGLAQNMDTEKASYLFAKAHLNNDATLLASYAERDKRVPTAPYGTIFNDPRIKDIDKLGFVDFSYQPKIADDKTALIRLYYDNYLYNSDWPYDYPPVTLNSDKAEGKWYGSEAQLSWEMIEGNHLIAGAEYENHEIMQQNKDTNPPSAPYLYDVQKFSNWSLYLQDEIATEQMGLTLGLRNDNYSGFGNVVNPRLAFVFNPLGESFVKILYGRAFRAPSAFEKYYHDGLNSMKPNPDLQPETISTFELVLEQGMPKRSFFSLSVFRNSMENLIDQTTDPSDGLLQFQNISQAQATGAELSLRQAVDQQGSYGELAICYQRVTDSSTNQQLTNSPEKTGRAAFVYRLPEPSASLATELIYVDQRVRPNGGYSPQYWLTNLNLITSAIFDAEIGLKISNLFDIDYYDTGSEANLQPQIQQDGRKYLITLSRGI